jgi:adenosylcobinamide-GDP ribazoletransferase
MKSIVAALRFLTILSRFTRQTSNAPMVGKAATLFPVIGLILGLFLALLARGLENYVDTEILSTTLVAFLVLATGGLHLEGLQKTFDEPALRQTATSAGLSSGAIGVAAIVIVILFKIKSMDILEEKLTIALLLTPFLARWAMLVFIYGSHRQSEADASRIAENVKFWHVLIATIATLAPVTYLLGRTGLLIALCLSVFSLVFRGLLQKRNSVLTAANLGAVIELCETLSLILLASL